jgi:hypothetical protein
VSVTRTVFINRKSGVAHVLRSCDALKGVPDGALRMAMFDDREPVPMRWCRWCSSPNAAHRRWPVQPARPD